MGKGTGSGQAADDDDDDKGLSADDIRRLVVGTVKDHVQKAIGKIDFKSMLGEAVAPLMEQVEALKSATAAAGERPKTGEQGGAAPPELKAQLDALQKKLDAAEAARKKAEDDQRQIAERSRRKEERDTLGAALRKAGVPEHLAAAAVAMLHGDKAVIKRDDDGGIRWANGDELVGIEDGLKGWLKSDEGKAFLPPRQVGGSGSGRNGTVQMPNGQRLTKDQEIELALGALADILPDASGMPGAGGQ